ncbi:hypothetical protein [Mucilaginibacter sp.]|uniref:hypothetical protein n=1 Tax=Mucilaginibacter sp. TaxID=1882438 RepID=UPI003D138CC1
MAYNLLKHKWHKIGAAALVAFAVVISILAFLVNMYWSPILADRVKEVVLKSSDSLYKADFSSAELHIIRGSIVFFNITLKPDTAVYNRKKLQHLAPNNLVEIHIKKLVLSHIHPFKLYFQHKLYISQVMLYEPVVSISYQRNHTKDTVEKDHRTAWEKISKSLNSVRIGSILMGDVKFRYEDYSGNKLAISELKEMNLSATDLLIDSATQTDKTRLLYCKDIVAQLNNYRGKTPNGLYTYKIDQLKLSTQKSQLDIEGFNLKPVNTDEFFAKTHKDRYTIHLDSLQLNNFDFLNYHKYRILNASRLTLKNGDLQVFGNPNSSPVKENKIKSFPNVALNNISADIKIDTAILRHINVTYNEYNTNSKKTGRVSFNSTSGRILNITTNKAAMQKNNISSVQLTSYFMNRGRLNLTFNFNLTDKNSSFNYKGSLGPMDLQNINPATMSLAMVKVNSGILKQLDFDVQADNKGAKGKLTFLYNNLKVSLLKADTNLNKFKRQTIASMFANLFILKHNNPDVAGGVPRSFYMDYKRADETPFFKMVWQTLLSGLKPSVGLDKKTVDATAAMLNEHKLNKQNHQIKKEERKLRRAERKRKRQEKKNAH